MSRYKGLFTFDEDNHRYVPIAQADGIINTMDYEPGFKPTEPLIKDEKIRKAVKAWAEALKLVNCKYDAYWKAFIFCDQTISFFGLCDFDLEDEKIYTIAELCGEEED